VDSVGENQKESDFKMKKMKNQNPDPFLSGFFFFSSCQPRSDREKAKSGFNIRPARLVDCSYPPATVRSFLTHRLDYLHYTTRITLRITRTLHYSTSIYPWHGTKVSYSIYLHTASLRYDIPNPYGVIVWYVHILQPSPSRDWSARV